MDKDKFSISRAEYHKLLDAYETIQIISELDPVKNNADDYRDAICAILEMRGWR